MARWREFEALHTEESVDEDAGEGSRKTEEEGEECRAHGAQQDDWDSTMVICRKVPVSAIRKPVGKTSLVPERAPQTNMLVN